MTSSTSATEIQKLLEIYHNEDHGKDTYKFKENISDYYLSLKTKKGFKSFKKSKLRIDPKIGSISFMKKLIDKNYLGHASHRFKTKYLGKFPEVVEWVPRSFPSLNEHVIKIFARPIRDAVHPIAKSIFKKIKKNHLSKKIDWNERYYMSSEALLIFKNIFKDYYKLKLTYDEKSYEDKNNCEKHIMKLPSTYHHIRLCPYMFEQGKFSRIYNINITWENANVENPDDSDPLLNKEIEVWKKIN